jgi:hypothetical protein
MDNRFSVFLWTLGGGLAFALLGGLFGGLSGWLSWRNGNASGSGLGRRVSDALAHLFAEGPTDGQKAALTGAADGALFLGILGILLGLWASQRETPADWVLPGILLLVLLGGGAALFGMLAYGLIGARAPALVGVFFGGMGGALLTARYVGVAHIVPGAVAGIFLGALSSFLFIRPSE